MNVIVNRFLGQCEQAYSEYIVSFVGDVLVDEPSHHGSPQKAHRAEEDRQAAHRHESADQLPAAQRCLRGPEGETRRPYPHFYTEVTFF